MKPLYKTVLTVLAGAGIGVTLTLGGQWGQEQWQRRAAERANQPPVLKSPLLIKGEPTLGSATAPVTIVEFSDFECPYCKRFHDEVFPQLKKNYIDKGLVRFVHKDLPLPFHEEAKPAAIAARCSSEQGLYWKTYEALFNKQTCLSCQGAESIAASTGVDQEKLNKCKQKGQMAKAVTASLSEAELQGIRATPTFVIGPSQNGYHSGEVIEGSMPWGIFEQAIQRNLHQVKGRP
jgi:protein-disulfide isomerase